MLCLCSQSRSRALLLQEAGIAFVQKPVDFDEERIKATTARDLVYLASKGKLEAAERAYGLYVPLLTADSVIELANGEIARKPQTREEARVLLQKQSGSRIAIISCVHYKRRERLLVDLSATAFTFDLFDEEAMEAYLASGEWQGAAGACMVEGFCKPYIRDMHGLESTARGLQVEILKPWLEMSE